MWRRVLRYGTLAYLSCFELLRRALGRRAPYGVLKLDISGELSEQTVTYRVPGLLPRSRDDYFSLLAVLRLAREDPQLRGVLIRCGELHTGWAKVQELRRNVELLRAAGRTVWVVLNRAGIREYVLASAADRVIVAPAATLELTGLSTEVTFLAGTLEKLGIKAELVQMGKYKSAAESFTRSAMSAAHQEMVESLLHDLYEQVVEAIAVGRGMEHDAVVALLDRGPFLAREALNLRLVDDVLYEDEAEEKLRELCDHAKVIEAPDHFRRRGRTVRLDVLRRGGPLIGVVHMTGTIKMDDSIAGPERVSACGVSSVCRDLQELRERPDVGAVVLRISSPGGSGLASDLIWHEVSRLRQHKPVVVSFGDVAASGGYYIAVAGGPVFAEGGTITGSIGVLAGKALLRGLYERIGVTKQIITRGRHAALYSDYVPLGDEERQRMQAEAQSFYSDFLDKVCAGRKLSRDAVSAVAEGRVWTGRQALARGLIDTIGGFEAALAQAKTLLGLDPRALVGVERYPKPRRLWRLALNLSAQQSRMMAMWPTVWPSLHFVTAERVWAVLPFEFRFF